MHDYDSTYVFFRCLILLKLFKPRIGLTRQIGIFLYNFKVEDAKDKGGKAALRALRAHANKTKAYKSRRR